MMTYRPAPWKPGYRLSANVIDEFKLRLPEFKEAGNWFLATGIFNAADFILHQWIPNIEGARTKNHYWSGKLIWTLPSLLVGRLISDYIVKGSDVVRAFTIGTVANLILAGAYMKTYPFGQLATFGLLHEALLVPLAFLITGPSPVTGFSGSESRVQK